MMAALRKSADEAQASTEAPSRDGRLKRKDYEKELRKLQVELCRLQDWVKYKGLRVVIDNMGGAAGSAAGPAADSTRPPCGLHPAGRPVR